MAAIHEALDKVQAIIASDLEGTVVSANENFKRIFGYGLNEIVGKHHRIFCEPGYAESDEYAALWQKLGRSEHGIPLEVLSGGPRRNSWA